MNLLNHIASMTILAELSPEIVFSGKPNTPNTPPGVASAVSGASNAWSLTMLIPIVLGAIGYLLIQHGVAKSRTIALAGVGTCLLAVGIAFGFTPLTFESVILTLFCTLAAGGGLGFLVAREPVYAALGFATAVLSVCGVLFMQSALFVAAATMIVYAGATIIIFLFVLMFAQQTELQSYDVHLNRPVTAAIIGAIVLATITMCVTTAGALLPPRADSTRAYSAADLPESLRTEVGKLEVSKMDAIDPTLKTVPNMTAGLGRSMYTDYLIAVELAGTVLLVATIGAIALAQRSTETQS